MKKNKKETKKIGKKIIYILFLLLLLLNLFIYFGMNWVVKNVGVLSVDEVIFHLKVPLQGTSHNMINDFIYNGIVPTVVTFIIIIIIFQRRYKCKSIFTIKIFQKRIETSLKDIVKIFGLIICLFILVVQFVDIDKKFKVIKYINKQQQNSKFIEENYVDPKSIKITFPDKKRNLVYIFLESMETSYMDRENGGNQQINLMPELTELKNEYIFGGIDQVYGANWTIAGMVAQTSGIPLLIPIQGNAYDEYAEFLPGAYSIGEILKKNEYNQILMVGSDAKFGGRTTYFKTHGNYVIKDLYTARKEKIVDKNYYEFWGIEDSKLFEYAKKEIIKLSKKDNPFNFTMLTVNTHFPNGYVENDCEEVIKDNSYANSIVCSSKQVYEFVKWMQEQNFYDNTTIIIVGDHLSMANNEILEKADGRQIYNVIINSLKDIDINDRTYSSFDMYPTTLCSIGADIEGDKLGLGVNLCSKKPTIFEKYGINYVNEELQKKSTFYNKNILYKK